MEKIKNFLFKNTTTKQTVVKNTFWLFFGEVLGRILKLAVLVFATRILGVEGWGVFSYALAFVSLFYIFADIGINTFITRELSNTDENEYKYKYLSASLVLKVILLTLSLIASLLLLPHFTSIILSIKIILSLALLNFSDSIREFALSVNRAMQKMEREAYTKIIMNGAIMVIGVILLTINPTPLSLAIAYFIGSTVATLITLYIVLPEVKNIEWRFPISMFKTIFNFAWPFIAVTIFITLIANIDTLMLGQIRSATEVGYYAAAQRIVQFIIIIPTYIAISLFPVMSKNQNDNGTLGVILEKTVTLVLIIGFPIAIGGYLLGQHIMTLVFGVNYLAGGMVLGILMLSLFADFPNILLTNIILAKNLQRKFLFATVFGLIINILLNLYLIPKYGAVGAALSTVASQLLIMIINWQMLKKYISFTIVPKLAKIALATTLMSIVILLMNRLHASFGIIIVISITTYIGLLYFLKEPSLDEAVALLKNR